MTHPLMGPSSRIALAAYLHDLGKFAERARVFHDDPNLDTHLQLYCPLMLLRVGRHSGAECVTLDGIRSIRIMKGRGQPPDWSPDGAKTVWLAAEREDERTGMLPFGWLILENAAAKPAAALERWCASQPKTRLAEVRAKLLAARTQIIERYDAKEARKRLKIALLAPEHL